MLIIYISGGRETRVIMNNTSSTRRSKQGIRIKAETVSLTNSVTV